MHLLNKIKGLLKHFNSLKLMNLWHEKNQVGDFVKHQMPSFLQCIFILEKIEQSYVVLPVILPWTSVFYALVFYRNLFVIRNPTVNLQGKHRMMLGQFTHLQQASHAIYWRLKQLRPSTSSYCPHSLQW